MPVRKTESRVPTGLQPSDLGHSVVAADGRCALVAALVSPFAVQRENLYVLMVPDPGLAGAAQSFVWTVSLGGAAPEQYTTSDPQIAYVPLSPGSLAVTVNARDGAGTSLATLTVNQDVVWPSLELEAMIGYA